jgi:putative ATP-binding cassette transporter
MAKLRELGRDIWTLTKGYWASEERLWAWGLLAAVVGLNLGLVYVNLEQNLAMGAVFNALSKFDGHEFYVAFVTLILLILLYLIAAVLRVYLDQTLQLRWRRWLTDQYLVHWLAHQTFYRSRFSRRVDNPDQRISEDIRLFIERTMALSIGVLNSVATVGTFAVLLWNLSGSITLSLNGFVLTIPGYMFWAAVLYSGLGSMLAHLVGRPLIRLNYRQQTVEADFRFSLLRLREEAEAIALYGGEAQERGAALSRFRALFENVTNLIRRNAQYLLFQLFFNQSGYGISILLASPRYFAGAIQLGTLLQISNAFERVNAALSWFIDNYWTFAEWRATVERLNEFAREIASENRLAMPGARIERAARQDSIELKDVSVALPSGEPLIAPITLSLKPREWVLLQGASGAGKSTLFRVLAGIWPFADGCVSLPEGAKALFLPQQPYMPIETLREALWYPARASRRRDDEAQTALEAVDLGGLARRLDESAHWEQILSQGEQQRIALARAILAKPNWLFMDEATSALDEGQEAALYRRLRAILPRTTVVSVGHRRSLEALHDRVLMLERAAGKPARLVGSGEAPRLQQPGYA